MNGVAIEAICFVAMDGEEGPLPFRRKSRRFVVIEDEAAEEQADEEAEEEVANQEAEEGLGDQEEEIEVAEEQVKRSKGRN